MALGEQQQPDDTLLSMMLSSWVFGKSQAVPVARDQTEQDEETDSGPSQVATHAEAVKMRENLTSRKFRKSARPTNAQHVQSVGVMLKAREETNEIWISDIISGSHAAAAGLQVQDVLVKIDGVPVDVTSLDDVMLALKGEPSSAITLTLLRKFGQSAHVVELTVRRDVPIEAMDMFASPARGIQDEAPIDQRKYIIKTAHGSMQAAIETVDDNSGTIFLSPVRNIRVFEYPDKSNRCVRIKTPYTP